MYEIVIHVSQLVHLVPTLEATLSMGRVSRLSMSTMISTRHEGHRTGNVLMFVLYDILRQFARYNMTFVTYMVGVVWSRIIQEVLL